MRFVGVLGIGAVRRGKFRILNLDSPLVGARNLQVLAVFRDCPSGDHDAFVVEHFRQLFVSQRLGGIFFIDKLFDFAFGN